MNVSELDDQILIKPTACPPTTLPTWWTDHLMGITHVIRGSEYLSSTPKYNLLYDAFGWRSRSTSTARRDEGRPEQAVQAQRRRQLQDLVAKGYLPQAVLNYLLLLGWAPEGEQEIFTLDEMIKIWGTPARISKSPAIFDPLKLRAINAAYIRALPPEEFRRLADPFIDSAVHRGHRPRPALCEPPAPLRGIGGYSAPAGFLRCRAAL